MIIFPLCCFLAGYLICGWLIPGFESFYAVSWLIACFPLHWLFVAFKQRDRFGFMRQWPENTIIGWGFGGERGNNDGYIYFDWQLKQIIWRKPRTYYTRAMRGGAGLGPGRVWFNIEADHGNRSCFTIHTGSRRSVIGRGKSLWPHFSINHYPQNNEPESAPC